MPFDAREIANFILDQADASSSAISPMALQKIIYFAHGWFLAKNGKPLILNRFEAWQFGPVVRCVYDNFKSFKGNPIQEARAQAYDLRTGELSIVQPNLPPEVGAFINQIFQLYSKYSAWELSEITHERGSPWHQIVKNPKANLGMNIPNDLIRSHFLKTPKTRDKLA